MGEAAGRTILWFVNRGFTTADLEAQAGDGAKSWMATLAREVVKDDRLTVCSIGEGPGTVSGAGSETGSGKGSGTGSGTGSGIGSGTGTGSKTGLEDGAPESEARGKGGIVTNLYIRPNALKWRLLLLLFFRPRNRMGDLLSQMKAAVDRVKPDLIHIHGSEGPFIEVASYAQSLGIPVLMSVQGITSVIRRKYFGSFDRGQWRGVIRKRGWAERRLVPETVMEAYREMGFQARREERCLPQIRNFAGRTSWDRQVVQLMSPGSRYFHVDRVLKPIFYEREWRPKEGGKAHVVIHTTMTNSTYKGFEVIAEACRMLMEGGLAVEWQLAGLKADDWSVRAVRRLLRDRYPAQGLVFLGRCDATGLVDSMLGADLYVQASHIENSPNSLAEAMLLGMPCVATIAGGTGTYLEDGETGLLVQAGDPAGLAGAVLELVRDREKAVRLGQAARKVARERHNPKRIKEQLQQAYDGLLEDDGGEHAGQ